MRITAVLVVLGLLAWGGQVALALQIAEKGKPKCVIVIGDDATAAEQHAAEDLQHYLRVLSGGNNFFQLQSESNVPADVPQIVVGPCARAKAALGNFDFASLGSEGIVMRSAGNQLVLAGGRPRGTLYAVDTFLEDVGGVRWWTSRDEFVPKKGDFVVDGLDVIYVPKLRYREAYYYDPIHDAQFAVHRRLNGHMTPIPAELGGHYEILGWCHTSYLFLPPDKYFADHPDWYSLQKGKRDPHNGQLCWSNLQMRAELVQNALKWIRRNPSAGIISISQNDCIGNCECDLCKAIDKEQGTPAGSLLAGVNAVAAEIKKEYPNFLVETLAYQHTRHPPKNLKPADNVLVRLCSIEADGAHPLDSEANRAFADDLRGWSALAPQLFIWNYVTNFNFPTVPHPNMKALGPDLRFFVDHHVVGVFEQADADNILAGDMLPLRTWLLSHLMWDPTKDQAMLINEFLNGYFGAAGPYLKQYLEAVNALSKDDKFRAGCFNQNLAYLTDDLLRRCHALFDQAEDAVKDRPTELSRVKRERLVLESLEIQRYDIPKAIEAMKKEIADPVEAAQRAVSDYEAKARDWAARAMDAGMLNHNYSQPTAQVAIGIINRGRALIPTTKPKTTP